MTLRAKLLAIVGTLALAFVVLLAVGSVIEGRIERELTGIREHYLPRLELGPKLQHDFETLARSIQDATAAQDLEALSATRALKEGLVAELENARPPLPARELADLRSAFDDYYAIATDVSRRLIENETGEALVEAMAGMQTKQVHAAKLLMASTAFDQQELGRAFTSAARAQVFSAQLRIVVILSCMLVVIVLAAGLGRSVLGSLSEVETGLQRFGRGELEQPIRVTSRDELGLLAQEANRMASNLLRLKEERDRTDWLKEGHAGLTRELRGELEPDQVATRVTRFVARYLDAPLGAFYAAQDDGSFKLAGSHGVDSAALTTDSFASGQGLVGQAALEPDITVISSLPEGYFRLRSGLGEGQPHALVLVPFVLRDRPIGVLELAVLKPWTDLQAELVRSVRETVTIAFEVARARTALRELLDQTQQQAERLVVQEEEVRSTNDELRAQQEELQAQQEELRQTNDELTAQSAEMLQQQRALEQKNGELAEARLRLEQKAEELTSVSAYKSQFLANMSHELRTPLNSMLLLSNLLAQNESKNLNERQVDFCKTIHGAGKDLLALINQVLDLAKIESGKQEAAFAPIKVRELGARVERIFGPLARDKGLELSVDVAERAPDEVVSDQQRIEQILNNLVGNAIKFTERGRVSVRIAPADPSAAITRGELERARTLAIVVQDTGIGIAPQHQESVFAPFEQVDGRPDRRYGGTGLGLSISRQLAALLGGELQLRSTPGEGSTFTCLLPYEPSIETRVELPLAGTMPPKAARARAIHDDSKELAPGDAHLLLVEDDPVFAEIVGEVIHRQGLKYVVASDGESALRLAKERKPSGVILDVKLPGVDGFAVMERLRAEAETAQTPVHFVSGLEAGERGMALGAVGYLTKPASRNDIVRVVQSLAPKSSGTGYRVLIVEDDAIIADSLVQRLRGDDFEACHASSAREALTMLKQGTFGCMVLDLSLPDMDGLELLRTLRDQGDTHAPPVIVYTGRPLSKAETQRIEAYAEAVVLKDGPGAERVLDEIRLFARRLKAGLPATRRLSPAPPVALRLEGKTLLLVDDDMRTVYALSAVLRSKGAEVLMADTGRAGIELLGSHPDVDIVLMDIMMPEMDGYEAIRRIRQDPRFTELPIIALTAKAMKGDREKCLEIGATDYLAKPVDPDALTAILHTRLNGAVAHGA